MSVNLKYDYRKKKEEVLKNKKIQVTDMIKELDGVG